MKKFFAVILVVVLMMSLCACGSNGDNNSSDIVLEVKDTEVLVVEKHMCHSSHGIKYFVIMEYEDYTFMSEFSDDQFIVVRENETFKCNLKITDKKGDELRAYVDFLGEEITSWECAKITNAQ